MVNILNWMSITIVITDFDRSQKQRENKVTKPSKYLQNQRLFEVFSIFVVL